MEFVCRVGTLEGQVFEERHGARDPKALRAELERRGLVVFSIERTSGLGALAGEGGLFKFRRKRIPLPQLLVFNQELAALLKAGLPLLQTLNLMLERMRDPLFRDVLTQVRDQVKSGVELSEAFASFGSLFPPLYASTLKAGERTGELEQVVRRFIRYLRLVIEARKKVVSALVYPSVLISLSFGLIAVLAVFVVPRFTVFYENLDVELPLITRIMIGVSTALEANALWIALGLAVTVTGFLRWRATTRGRLTIDRWRLRLPFLGPVLHRFAQSELCRSLSTLLSGGLPLVPALEISVDGISNRWVRQRVLPTIGQVREGKSFHISLESTGMFSDLVVDMVKVGEATGALDQMLASVSEFLDEEVETRMQRILTLIEPLMMIVMGTIVAMILIAVYLPMFSVLGNIR